jgi:hypothetical protein
VPNQTAHPREYVRMLWRRSPLRREGEHRTVNIDGKASANSVGMLAKLSKEGMGIAMSRKPMTFLPFPNGGSSMTIIWQEPNAF